ncbi:E3 ubiquitin-protein ligase TRIM71-like [Anneissia japonica]|uniref:E3 ubiquitin-protein ligase TRIM71-like n=1 Tax=Anneissia japonica TaxID=1529436 RepID=UPI0014257434|nr:E3 ubiquitin-protein ligase TRIM71-like [Anneissia japonica]
MSFQMPLNKKITMPPKIQESQKRSATELQPVTNRRPRLEEAPMQPKLDVTEPSTSCKVTFGKFDKGMSVSKALQFMDKKDLECAICLNRFHQPKTLNCMHTYCLHCIQKWVETHGKMKCPTCKQEHDLIKEDLKKLASNTMISQLLEYVTKTEERKPTNCSFCDNQPAYHCSTCQLYLCGGNCIKQHKILPSTKDHPLYTLDKKEQDGSSDKQTKCSAHCNITLAFYCTTCNKSACEKCEHILHCNQQQHKVISMSTAVGEFNKDATDAIKLASKIQNVLKQKLEFIAKDRPVFDTQLNLCRTAIEILEIKIIKKVQEKSQELISTLENIYKEKQKNIDSKIKDIDAELNQINDLMTSLNSIMNKPEERESLRSHKATIDGVRDRILGTDFDKLFHIRNFRPDLIPSTHLDELMNTEGIGKITTVESMMYTVQGKKHGDIIHISQELPFEVIVSSSETESGACNLAATLINTSGEELATEVRYQGNGKYKIKGDCDVLGNWRMNITAGSAHITGSPFNVKVTEYDDLF